MNLNPASQLILYGHRFEFCNFIDLYKDKKLPNKILLSGEKGIGKSTLAYHLINCILSFDEENAYDEKNFTINPENKSFKLILNKSNPNFISIDIEDDKKSIDISQIRNLILNLNKSSFNTKPRLVLIDNIELLNINSVNALLKIVEEPNENIFFILINNNKKILPTLKSRCLNYNINLKSEESFDISNKILGENVKELIHKQMISNYSTPGSILNLLNFANTNGVDLRQMNLKDFIKMIINEKKYKKDYFIKHLLYSLIELYFRQNVSLRNIKLLKIQNYFLKKINNTKIFNLDDETLLMEFDDKVLNG
jgi:DNA polymerase-3 subunit delta'